MRITLTGTTGFIGGHIAKYLGQLGYEIDMLGREEFMNEYWGRLDDFGLSSGFSEPSSKIKVKPDIVIHCAWIRDRDLHDTKHLEFAERTCNFFKECKQRGIRVINLGSSSEYGVKYKPMKENMRCEPINTYGIAKLMVTLYAKKLGFNTLRLFTVTGEGGHSFFDIKEKAEKWSDKYQVRDYISIETVCLAIQRLMHANHLYGEIINVCSGKQVANVETEGDNRKWDKHAQRQFEQSCWVGSTDRLNSILNVNL